MSDVKEFLSELWKLSKKYNISISSCGCCDGINIYSPSRELGQQLKCSPLGLYSELLITDDDGKLHYSYFNLIQNPLEKQTVQ